MFMFLRFSCSAMAAIFSTSSSAACRDCQEAKTPNEAMKLVEMSVLTLVTFSALLHY